MQLTQENSTLLFHYCKEIADALRPILNTKQFDNVDENYWIEKLSEFKNILLQILETENLPSPAPVTDRYINILNSTLQSLLNNIPGYPITNREAIVTAFDITEEVMAKLKARNQ